MQYIPGVFAALILNVTVVVVSCSRVTWAVRGTPIYFPICLYPHFLRQTFPGSQPLPRSFLPLHLHHTTPHIPMAMDELNAEKRTKPNASHNEDAVQTATTGWAADLDDARNASNAEHTISLKEAFRTYPKAILWSVAISLGIVMEGYDTSLVGSLYAQPAFQKQYGNPYQGGYQLSASWQVALGLSSTIGIIVGIFMNGWFTEKFGFRKVLLVSYVLITAFISIPFTAKSVEVLFGGEVLCGVPWGVFATLGE